MSTVEGLCELGDGEPGGGRLDPDPLRDADALQEVQLLDSRTCPLTASAALLLELRTSLQFDEGNAALLVVRGLRSLTWDLPDAQGSMTAFSVVSSVPELADHEFALDIRCHPSSGLTLTGRRAEFYVLDVEGVGAVPPDYTEMTVTDARVHLPAWDSVCRVLQASCVG